MPIIMISRINVQPIKTPHNTLFSGRLKIIKHTSINAVKIHHAGIMRKLFRILLFGFLMRRFFISATLIDSLIYAFETSVHLIFIYFLYDVFKSKNTHFPFFLILWFNTFKYCVLLSYVRLIGSLFN